MISYIYKEYCIEIFEDDSYKINSTDNKNKYDFEYAIKDYLNYYRNGYFSQCAVRIRKGDIYIKSVILLSTGGKSFTNKNSAIIENDRIMILVGKTVFCLGLINLNEIWHTDCDESVCFAIYKVDKGFITHGEQAISKINENGKIEWQFYGRDIFVTLDGIDNFNISENIITVLDWDNNTYYIDLNGKEIKK